MHAREFLHKQLAADHSKIHKTRLISLTHAVTGLLASEVLQLTAIGRHLMSECSDKHAIKRVDRLLGNNGLVNERADLYKWQAHKLMGRKKHPLILLDYSDVNAQRTHFILRAAVALKGRSLVVYEEVHDRENYAPYWRKFLATLAALLPTGCEPVIVTDAGFRGPWRKAFADLGWYYVIRQRNRDFVCSSSEDSWHSCKALYQYASKTPKYLGEFLINRSEPDCVNVCIVHHPAKNRKKMTSTGMLAKSKHSNKNAAREREPWLLITNLNKTKNIAKKVVDIYATRMQIEESFRDLKSYRYGFSFRGNRCCDIRRLQALLLIAALASFTTWLMGLYAEYRGLHRRMQANTITSRRVLSIFTVGLNVFRKSITITHTEWLTSVKHLNSLVRICN